MRAAAGVAAAERFIGDFLGLLLGFLSGLGDGRALLADEARRTGRDRAGLASDAGIDRPIGLSVASHRLQGGAR